MTSVGAIFVHLFICSILLLILNERFEGMMVPSRGQAALLTFCTCISLASVALVLTITVPDVGNNWFWITTLSPLA
ncbi:hypothetical protein GBA52_028534 [Prunus armeniaca]|nr:hypothetical protein GBA52_028534 [Prunus armeniaca]